MQTSDSVILNEAAHKLLENLNIKTDSVSPSLSALNQGESRYIRDLRVNLDNTLNSDHLSEKETHLLALAIATNDKNEILVASFQASSATLGASPEEIAESIACASLLSANNVLYRFWHLANKEKYEQLQARIKMNIMARPVLGKEFFELLSLAVSAVNACERCIRSHESSLIALGSSEERIWDAIRLASVVHSLDRIVH